MVIIWNVYFNNITFERLHLLFTHFSLHIWRYLDTPLIGVSYYVILLLRS